MQSEGETRILTSIKEIPGTNRKELCKIKLKQISFLSNSKHAPQGSAGPDGITPSMQTCKITSPIDFPLFKPSF
jgi:hypothetical protein